MCEATIEGKKYTFRDRIDGQDLIYIGMPTALFKMMGVNGDYSKLNNDDMSNYLEFVVRFLTQLSEPRINFRNIDARVILYLTGNEALSKLMRSLIEPPDLIVEPPKVEQPKIETSP
jgi:hypothetical protein